MSDREYCTACGNELAESQIGLCDSCQDDRASKMRILPPDPEDMNDERAEWAEEAVNRFVNTTGTDRSDALADMLSDIMHWCDRNHTDFDKELERARSYYAEETDDIGTAGAQYTPLKTANG